MALNEEILELRETTNVLSSRINYVGLMMESFMGIEFTPDPSTITPVIRYDETFTNPIEYDCSVISDNKPIHPLNHNFLFCIMDEAYIAQSIKQHLDTISENCINIEFDMNPNPPILQNLTRFEENSLKATYGSLIKKIIDHLSTIQKSLEEMEKIRSAIPVIHNMDVATFGLYDIREFKESYTVAYSENTGKISLLEGTPIKQVVDPRMSIMTAKWWAPTIGTETAIKMFRYYDEIKKTLDIDYAKYRLYIEHLEG